MDVIPQCLCNASFLDTAILLSEIYGIIFISTTALSTELWQYVFADRFVRPGVRHDAWQRAGILWLGGCPRPQLQCGKCADESGSAHYPFFVLMHALFFVAWCTEVVLTRRPPPIWWALLSAAIYGGNTTISFHSRKAYTAEIQEEQVKTLISGGY